MLRKGFTGLIGCVFLMSISTAEENDPPLNRDVREPEELYRVGHYSASLSLLNVHTSDPASLFLIGRDYYMLGEFKKATEYFKKAAVAAPENSEYVDWLGRAYGKRSDISNPLSAAALARKQRETFERAVQLNPKNAEALSDLFHYYLQAPAILGGNYEKAENVAEKMFSVDPTEAYFEQWQLARKRDPFQAAEQTARGSLHRGPNDVALAVLPSTKEAP